MNHIYIVYLVEDSRFSRKPGTIYETRFLHDWGITDVNILGAFSSMYDADRIADEYNKAYESQSIGRMAMVKCLFLDEFKDHIVKVPCSVEAYLSRDGNIDIEEDSDYYPEIIPSSDKNKIDKLETESTSERTIISYRGYNKSTVKRKVKKEIEELRDSKIMLRELKK